MTNKMIKHGLLIVFTVIAIGCNKAPVIDENEKEWLKNHPDLSIGISSNQPPYQFINEKGELNGMFIDFLTIIEDQLNYKFKKIYQPDWTRLLSDAKEGNVDIVLEIQETNERKEYLNFTPFLVSHKHVIVVKNKRRDITSVSDLKDKKIAVVDSFAILGYLLKNYPGYSIIPVFDNVAGLRAVSTGQADAFITQQAVATYYIEAEGISNLKIVGEIDYPNELGIASRKNLDTLNTILSKAVNSITKTEKQNVYNQWLSSEVKPFYAEAKFWIVILVVLLGVLTFVILFNLVLRKRVEQKTKELSAAKEKVEESYALLRIAGEKAKLGGWNVNLTENRSYWSDGVAKIHGMPPGYSPLVEDGINFYAPECRDKIIDVFSRCAQEGIPYDEEMEIITSTGKRVWVRTIGEAVRDDQGKIVKVQGAFQDISERKRAEDTLRLERSSLNSVLENMQSGVFFFDEKGENCWMNPEALRIHGFSSASDMLERFSQYTQEWELSDSDGRVLSTEEWPGSRAFRGERFQNFEVRIRHLKSGCTSDVLYSCAEVRNVSGNIERLVFTILDITERKQAEEKIREKDIQFRKLSANVPDLIFQFTRKPDGTYCVPIASEGIRNIFGCSPEDVLDDFGPIARVIYAEDAEQVIRDIEYSAEHLTHFTSEFRVQIPGREIQWIYSKSTPERLPDGSITWYGFNTDITYKKLAEEALKKSEIEFRSLAESMPQIVWITRADGWNIYFNQQWVDYTGLTLEESYGAGWNKPFHPDDQQRSLDAWQNAVNNKGTYSIEVRMRRFDGEYRWWLIRGIPLLNDNGEILKWFGTCTDIDSIKHTENALFASEQLLLKSQAVAHLGSFCLDLSTCLWESSKILDEIFGIDNDYIHSIDGWNAILHPDWRQTMINYVREDVLKKHQKYNKEFQIIKPNDGKIRWVHVLGELEFDVNNKPTKLVGTILDITERKLSEETLRLERYNLNSVLENMQNGVFFFDEKGENCWMNPEALRIHGFSSASEMLERFSQYTQEWELSDPTGRVLHIEEWPGSRALRGERYQNYEIRLRHLKSGRTSDVLYSCADVRDISGNIERLVFTILDISERKHAEIELLESEKNFRRSISDSPVGIRIVTIDGKTIFTNKTFLDIFELKSLEEFISSSALNRYTPKSYLQHQERKKKRKNGQEVYDYEISFNCCDGEIRHVKVSRKEVLWNGIKHFQVINLDITEQRNAEKQLRKLSRAVEQSPDAICITDPDGIIEYINPRTIELTGFSENELINENASIFSSGNKSKEEYAQLWQTLKSGNIWSGELHNKKKNGELYWESTTISPIFDLEGQITHFLAIKEDVTERKRVDIALNNSEEQLRKFASHLQNVREE